MAVLLTKNIERVSSDILSAAGVPIAQTDIIASSIVDAHRKEKHTHGLGRLPIYIRKIKSGQMESETRLEIVRSKGCITVFDAHNGFGQIAAHEGMLHCIDKASNLGVGIAVVKDSNSFGAAGFYGETAASHFMIGIVMGNSSPALSPHGGNKACLGTNPICFAFPGTDKNPHIIFDMACSVAARGKVRLAAKNGERIPIEWGLDSDGNPTDDPLEVLSGSMNASGGYKGFGLAAAAEILAGILSGSAFADDVLPLNAPKGYSRYGHFLCAIDPEFFLERNDYMERIDCLINKIKACGDPGCVFLPGERSHAKSIKNIRTVNVSDAVIADVNHLAASLSIEQLC